MKSKSPVWERAGTPQSQTSQPSRKKVGARKKNRENSKMRFFLKEFQKFRNFHPKNFRLDRLTCFGPIKMYFIFKKALAYCKFLQTVYDCIFRLKCHFYLGKNHKIFWAIYIYIYIWPIWPKHLNTISRYIHASETWYLVKCYLANCYLVASHSILQKILLKV